MWTIREVKARGWESFRRGWWKSVLAALLLSLTGRVVIPVPMLPRLGVTPEELLRELQELIRMLRPLLGLAVGGAAYGALLAAALKIFLWNPLSVGIHRYFLLQTKGEASLSELGFAFGSRYTEIVKTLFLRDLYIALWSLLFMIPGIVRAYSYRLVPYILAEHPEMNASEILRTSRRLMRGNKAASFWLDFSFIGWDLLSVLTLGLLGVLLVEPYRQTALAYQFLAIAYPSRWNRNAETDEAAASPAL